MSTDPQFAEYLYNPRPWPDERPLPNAEFWHFFMHPEDCGTSTYLNDTLPTRLNGPIEGNRVIGFGVHIVERYSVLVIFVLPSIVTILVLLAPTLWFFKPWLTAHPDDLQNAAVPFSMVSGPLFFLLNMVVTVALFRFTVDHD